MHTIESQLRNGDDIKRVYLNRLINYNPDKLQQLHKMVDYQQITSGTSAQLQSMHDVVANKLNMSDPAASLQMSNTRSIICPQEEYEVFVARPSLYTNIMDINVQDQVVDQIEYGLDEIKRQVLLNAMWDAYDKGKIAILPADYDPSKPQSKGAEATTLLLPKLSASKIMLGRAGMGAMNRWVFAPDDCVQGFINSSDKITSTDFSESYRTLMEGKVVQPYFGQRIQSVENYERLTYRKDNISRGTYTPTKVNYGIKDKGGKKVCFAFYEKCITFMEQIDFFHLKIWECHKDLLVYYRVIIKVGAVINNPRGVIAIECKNSYEVPDSPDLPNSAPALQ